MWGRLPSPPTRGLETARCINEMIKALPIKVEH